MHIGIDAGSVSVKTVVTDSGGKVVFSAYRRHHGAPLRVAREMLAEAASEYGPLPVACTGSSGRRLAAALGAPHFNELSAFARGAAALRPDAASLFEMGGEDSKFLLLEDGQLADFGLNSVCAAGTGSFLDQQAERMGLSPEEFAELALESRNPPRVAGRCSVFAKSDMIHLQQIATPLRDIAGGLCFSVARNFRGAIVRGRPTPGPALFLGGVSLNKGVLRAFREVFGMEDIEVPEHSTQFGALGAALRGAEAGTAVPLDLDGLDRALARDDSGATSRRKPLIRSGDRFQERHAPHPEHRPERLTGPLYMGIDIGSISTNLAVTDEHGRLLSKRYLRTASKPIEAVRTGLAEIKAELDPDGGGVDIAGVGTTGSGRYMIADFTGADIVKNEITAQATAAAFIDPEVDTIFEIGGQDSKFISLRDGVIVDFEMNKACAAGTGSFLEEQAEKLGVDIKGEFAERALKARAPARLGERCTVFMENSLQAGASQGVETDDLLAGLAYSIVENYIGRVVSGRTIGERIFFQGGTAFNRSVTAAFEKHLGLEVTVPPNHDVTGAIGMALIARDHMRATGGESTFRGFDLAHVPFEQSSFECQGCDNRCEINRVKIEGSDAKLFYGGRCEKYDQAKKKPDPSGDLFRFREETLRAEHEQRRDAFTQAGFTAPRGVMGLPMVFFMHDYLPYFSTLLWELGFEPRLSPRTSRKVVGLGVEAVLADTCFPIKAAQGHVRALLEEGVDRLFLPSFTDLATPEDDFDSAQACPLTQSFPYQITAALPRADVIAPTISLRLGTKPVLRELHAALHRFGVGKGELKRAMRLASQAQARYAEAIRERGREYLDNLEGRALVIMGRAYNAFDPGMNLDLPAKAAALGENVIPMDFLPPARITDSWPYMYWRSGQRILSAARVVRDDPRLFPLYLGNFCCGPDSFILKFFNEEMRGKPALHLEIDEHSADAGAITRVEAFLDSLDALPQPHVDREARPKRHVPFRPGQGGGRTIYVPPMCDHAHGLAAAFRHCGLEARVMDEAGDEAMERARHYVSGKECYPCAVTVGEMLGAAASPIFKPDSSAFFMPGGTGPCRFGQYNLFHRMALDRAGLPQVPIFAPVQDASLYEELGLVGSRFSRRAWEATVAFDLLTKMLHETRPTEATPGQTDALYQDALRRLEETLASDEEDIAGLLQDIGRDFQAVPQTGETRPLIGVVGEIFVRSNRFSNEDLVRNIEALGGRAWLAPVDEWILYVGYVSRRKARQDWDYKRLLKLWLEQRVQDKITHHLEAAANGFLHTLPEPSTREVIDNAKPYMRDTFQGEAILSVGKTVDMAKRGAVGIVNAMPFGCMPGTVATAVLRRVCDEHSLPAISMPFDGTASPTLHLTLETFMEQCRQRVE
ncbi:acyl-CoA dehydratase activase [Desulfohalovibrio reitneri]|uniref:acyl-CoA dehydratase activase n=1 Tax=Desulfohalovibrio reitneri TaxID=1307759 RepID=UPI0004A6D207|nr:acyl-CoA dehydratase activase [Desulfohalovibrio reitneri]